MSAFPQQLGCRSAQAALGRVVAFFGHLERLGTLAPDGSLPLGWLPAGVAVSIGITHKAGQPCRRSRWEVQIITRLPILDPVEQTKIALLLAYNCLRAFPAHFVSVSGGAKMHAALTPLVPTQQATASATAAGCCGGAPLLQVSQCGGTGTHPKCGGALNPGGLEPTHMASDGGARASACADARERWRGSRCPPRSSAITASKSSSVENPVEETTTGARSAPNATATRATRAI